MAATTNLDTTARRATPADPRWSGFFFAARDRTEQLGKCYVSLVVAAGAALIGWACTQLLTDATPPQWVVLMAATIFAGVFTVRVRVLTATVSISDVGVLSLAALFGAAPAIVTVAVDGLLASSRARTRATYRTLFNLTEPAVSVAGAAIVYTTFSRGDATGAPWTGLVPLLGLVITYLLLNTVLSATAIRFETQRPVWQTVHTTAPYLGLNGVLCLGLLTLIVQQGHGGDLPSPQVLALAAVTLALSYVVTKVYFSEVDATHRRGSVV